jgi:hypothetical protein
MSIETPLKPCPFCDKGEPTVNLQPTFESEASSSPKPVFFWVACDATRGGCGSTNPGYAKSRMEAVNQWNRRAPAPSGDAPKGLEGGDRG